MPISSDSLSDLYGSIRDVPDFPKPGIVFKDITPLLLNHELLGTAIEQMTEPFRDSGIQRVLSVESRGFILGAPIAMALEAGLVLARKVGKLPWKTRRVEYSLEYGSDAIEVHVDSIDSGQRVLVVDDVLATGGTAEAAARSVTEAGAELVGFSFLIELSDLSGRAKLPQGNVSCLLSYPRK
ncbi:MAG: adenine phosphoribosyltransferase [Gemmatimonadales bacterium]